MQRPVSCVAVLKLWCFETFCFYKSNENAKTFNTCFIFSLKDQT